MNTHRGSKDTMHKRAFSYIKKLWAKRALRYSLCSFLSVLLVIGGYLGYLQLSGNFHTVVEGELYRSAQVTPSSLAYYQQHYGIKTVINLRGKNTGKEWYDEEVAAARDLGLTHYDFRMSAKRPLTQHRAAEILALIKSAPKPVLIHCQAGADRTGLVSALYISAVAGKTEWEAERALSLRYGHIGIPYLSVAYPMDETWEMLEPWLGIEGS